MRGGTKWPFIDLQTFGTFVVGNREGKGTHVESTGLSRSKKGG